MKSVDLGRGKQGSHTALANSVLAIPSNASFFIYPDSWNDFCAQIGNLLRKKLPSHTKYAYAAIVAHGLKSDRKTANQTIKEVTSSALRYTVITIRDSFCVRSAARPRFLQKSIIYSESYTFPLVMLQRINLIVDISRSSQIYLSQLHVAATMRKEGQIIVADFSRLKSVLETHKLHRYECFGLDKRGNFTAEGLKPTAGLRGKYGPNNHDEYDDVSYLQVKRKSNFETLK